jgi:ornithine--oxo-acid transaminase
VVVDEQLAARSAELGAWLLEELRGIRSPVIADVRGKGLLTGLELKTLARPYCERLLELGVLCKETHTHTIRLAPPLVVSRDDLAWLVGRLRDVFEG